MDTELIKKDRETTLFVITHKLSDCRELLKPKINNYFDTIKGNLSKEEIEYANILYSLYDRIDSVLEYANSLKLNKK